MRLYGSFQRLWGKIRFFAAPGNAGMAESATLLAISPETDNEAVVEACRRYGIDFVFVGPEIPLANGIVDALNEAGIAAFGPHKEAARLESSKVFSKEFMNRHRIPTAEAQEFQNPDDFIA